MSKKDEERARENIRKMIRAYTICQILDIFLEWEAKLWEASSPKKKKKKKCV